jgi:uncharacterized SAM-binding protein YcdF (DUF218 family)
MTRRNRNQERIKIRGWVFVLLLIVALYLLRATILTGLGAFLVTEDYLQKADLIFLDSGSVETAPFHAATLWKQGLAPAIVLGQRQATRTVEMGLQPNKAAVCASVLGAAGVPAEFIVILPESGAGIRSEMNVLLNYIEENSIESLIVVTSLFRTRRFRWITDRELNPEKIRIQLAAASNPDYGTGDWWQSERGFAQVLGEYSKLLHYLVFQ